MAYQVQLVLKWIADQVLDFDWIAGSSHIKLLYDDDDDDDDNDDDDDDDDDDS